MITVNDANALVDAAKALANLRIVYEKSLLDLGRAKSADEYDRDRVNRISSDILWIERQIGEQMSATHAAAVNAGVADMRPTRAYAPVTFKAGPFTSYTHHPARPRAMLIGGAA